MHRIANTVTDSHRSIALLRAVCPLYGPAKRRGRARHEAQMRNFAVIGGGAWGTALAQSQAAAGRKVVLWARDAGVVADINAKHRNERRLPGIALDPRLRATSELAEAAASDVLLLAVPAQHMRATCLLLKPHLTHDTQLVICAKGFEQVSGSQMSRVVNEATDRFSAVLSGPGFASDVARGLPTAQVLAAIDWKTATKLGNAIGHKALRIYFSDDVLGVQMGGAVKNVLAIAAGIVAGRKLGASAHAALVTRAFHELTGFGHKWGGSRATFTGLSCLGDLLLTCNSPQSRNFTFGRHLGEGLTVAEALAATGGTVEGIYTAAVVDRVARAGKHAIDMPIASAVHRIVSGELTVEAAIDELADRPQKSET